MPRAIPKPVQDRLDVHFPKGAKLYWIRGEFMESKEIEKVPFISGLMGASKPSTLKDTVIQVEDLDDPGRGYEVRLEGAGFDLEEGDRVSLIGHALEGETDVPTPRLVYFHATDQFCRCWGDTATLFGKLRTEVDHKKSLAVTLPPTPQNRLYGFLKAVDGWFLSELTPKRDRIRNMALAGSALGYWMFLRWLGPGGGWESVWMQTQVHPWLGLLLVPILLLPVLAIMTAGVMATGLPVTFLGWVLVKLIHLWKEPPRFRRHQEYSFGQLCGWSNVSQYFGNVFVEATYCYEEAAVAIHKHAVETGLVSGEELRGIDKARLVMDAEDGALGLKAA